MSEFDRMALDYIDFISDAIKAELVHLVSSKNSFKSEVANVDCEVVTAIRDGRIDRNQATVLYKRLANMTIEVMHDEIPAPEE